MKKLTLLFISLISSLTMAVTTNSTTNKSTSVTNHIINGNYNESTSTMSGSTYIDADGFNVPINKNNN